MPVSWADERVRDLMEHRLSDLLGSAQKSERPGQRDPPIGEVGLSCPAPCTIPAEAPVESVTGDKGECERAGFGKVHHTDHIGRGGDTTRGRDRVGDGAG